MSSNFDISNLDVTKSSISKRKVILGVSGSVATIKAHLIVQQLLSFCEVKVITTSHSLTFLKRDEIPQSVPILEDEKEWLDWKTKDDPVLHIDLRNWADLLIIAPLSANTLGKLANGLCDNLLTCICRAWDFEKPIIVAPAMNTFMWEHPHTSKHIKELESIGVQIISPIYKKLACKEVGIGAMAEVETIVNYVKTALTKIK